jgi:glycosyltransferase involved in cell wall biosynthesis
VIPSTVSILTPSFNREDLVAETLESVLAQNWPHWENIIVDDGSTDRTKEIVAEYVARDPRFKLFDRTGGPKGACTCRNEGVARSAGKYVMFLDTDDIIEPFCLEQRVAAMESRPELDFAIFPGLMFERTPNDLGLWWNVDKDEDELSRQFKQDAICQSAGALWRKDSFERIGMWHAKLMLWQDVDLFFRAYIQGYRYAKFFDLPPDLHNRISPKSLSREAFFEVAKTASRCEVVKRAVHLLEENELEARRREARFITAEIISGAARSGQDRVAADMIAWGVRHGVLSFGEACRLACSTVLRRARLSRLGAGPIVRSLEASFSCDSTLGRIPVRQVGGPDRQAA